MSRRMLQPLQFGELRYEKDVHAGLGSIEVHHPDPAVGQIGQIAWNVNPQYKSIPVGGITSIDVHPSFQRRGLATHMFRMAQEMDPRVQHGPVSAQTPVGKKWAKKVPNER